MSQFLTIGDDYIERRHQGEYLRIEAWTENCIRVRCTLASALKPFDWAISQKPTESCAKVTQEDGVAILRNGKLAVKLLRRSERLGLFLEAPLCFFDAESGKTLLQEKESDLSLPDPGHDLKAMSPSSFRADVRFLADEDEKFYGLGHNQQGFLNQKGCTLELRQMNTHSVVPVLYSSRGYGFFWNNPAYGRVELARNGTRWTAEQTDQIDYFVFYGSSPGEVMTSYAKLTGFPSMMPDWAMGFWQSKLRYRNSEELTKVVEEYKRRGLPLSVVVIDFYHWPRMGEWDFDARFWPDAQGMIGNLKRMGVETMVSIWPMVNPKSTNFDVMNDKGYLVRAESGLPVFVRASDTDGPKQYLHLVDFTNPEAARFVWNIAKKNYYDRGVRLFWLDECEPEIIPYDTHNLRYHVGNGAEYSSLYPLFEEKTFFEAMKAAGESLPINLCRAAWAGSQKYGACIWSGDIYSDFRTLKNQVKAGLNMAMAGIPWWTSDIGGFFGGDLRNPEFRELMVRWFQWGVFCSVFRTHGFRSPLDTRDSVKGGDDNEIWSFGEEAYEIIKGLLFMRERMRPYIKQQMQIAHETGIPPMRPLFFDFPGDRIAYDIDDEFLFGPDVLVAPVVQFQQRKRSVYLPTGAEWNDPFTRKNHQGGQRLEVETPLERIPVFLKNDARVPIRPD